MQSDIILSGLLSGIDLSDWDKRSLKKFSDSPQNITGFWDVRNHVVFKQNLTNVGLINGMKVEELARDVEEKFRVKNVIEDKIIVSVKIVV